VKLAGGNQIFIDRRVESALMYANSSRIVLDFMPPARLRPPGFLEPLRFQYV